MARRLLVALMISLGAGGVLACAAHHTNGDRPTTRIRDTETDIVLDQVAKDCVDNKSLKVIVYKGRKITWRVSNDCSDEYTLTIGNIRKEWHPVGLPRDCSNLTYGIDLPFKGQEKHTSETVPSTKSRQLFLTNADIKGTYFYDICLQKTGSTDIRKLDPRLVIE